MVLGSSHTVNPKRISWEISTDRCPYFDNYAKYDSNNTYTETHYVSQNVDFTINNETINDINEYINTSHKRIRIK
jgi:hypothetical protein